MGNPHCLSARNGRTQGLLPCLPGNKRRNTDNLDAAPASLARPLGDRGNAFIESRSNADRLAVTPCNSLQFVQLAQNGSFGDFTVEQNIGKTLWRGNRLGGF